MKSIKQVIEENLEYVVMEAATADEVSTRVKLFTRAPFTVNDDLTVSFTYEDVIRLSNATEKELGFTITDVPSGEMRLSECLKLVSLKGLPASIKRFTISDCNAIKTLDGIPSADVITISSCNNLVSLKGINKCTFLRVASCKKLASLDFTSAIRDVDINYCQNLKNIKLPPSPQEGSNFTISNY